MARSKRSTSQAPRVRKHDRAHKQSLITTIQTACSTYPYIYSFRLHNARTPFFQRLRRQLSDSCQFSLGQNKVVQKALGKTKADAYKPGLEQVALQVNGTIGLLFSKLNKVELDDALSGFSWTDYSRPGSVAPHRVVIENCEGGLCRMDDMQAISPTLEPQLRAAGLPVMLKGGQVFLTVKEFVVCEADCVLNASQVKLLKAFGLKLDEFSVEIASHFDVEKGTFF